MTAPAIRLLITDPRSLIVLLPASPRWSTALLAAAPIVLLLVALFQAAPCAAQFPAEIEGAVTDAATGAPVPFATIQSPGLAAVETEGRGAFRLRGLDPGSLTLLITSIGYRPQQLVLTLANGEHRSLDIRLNPVLVVLPEVVTTTSAERPGVTVLGRAEIESSGRADLGSLLEGQNGVLIERRGGPGGPATISIRGSGSGQVLVLLDGVPLNDALTGSADLSLVALGTLDSVTIRRGGASERYGSRAMGGVVQLYSRRGGNVDGFGIGARGGSYGERGFSGSAAASRAEGSGRLTAQANADLRDVNGDFQFEVPSVRGGGTAQRINAGSEQRAAQGSAGYQWGGGDFRLRGDWLSVERGMPGTVVQQSLSATQRQRRLGGGADLRLHGGRVSWFTEFGVQHQRASFQDTDPPFGAPYHDSLTALNLTAQSGVDFTPGSWTLSSGVELRSLRPRGSALSSAAPETQSYGGAWLSAALRRPWTTSGFVQLSAAARGDGGSGVGDAVISPRLSASVGQGGWSLSASWGGSFSPPTLGDLFFQEGVQVRANPDLRPERVRNEVTLSAGLSEQPLLGAGIRATVTAYRADTEDMILWSPNFAYVWSPNNFNIDRQGVEAEVTTRLPSLNAEFGASAAYNRLTYTGSVLTGQVIYRPRWSGNSHLDFTALGIRAGLLARYVGARRTGIGSDLNRLPAFAILDFHLSRRFRLGHLGLELSGGVDNLSDQRTTLLVDYPSPGRSWWLGTRLSLGRDGPGSADQ
ncbi:MAG: TonB-dependent receptor [Gemmatimonadota bacterium]